MFHFLAKHSLIPDDTISLSDSYTRLVPSQSVEGGVLVRSSEFKESSLLDNSKDISIFDWSLGNILAVGATNLLKPVSFASSDVDSLASKVDKFAETLDKLSSESNA